jgi:hypothetical protein
MVGRQRRAVTAAALGAHQGATLLQLGERDAATRCVTRGRDRQRAGTPGGCGGEEQRSEQRSNNAGTARHEDELTMTFNFGRVKLEDP